MAVTLTKHGSAKTSLKPLRQQFRRDFKNNDKRKTSDTNDQSKYSGWNNLPYVVLVEIYRCLPNQDKFSLSLTCKAWSKPFSRPEVWRHVLFRFDGIEEWRAMFFTGPMVSGLRHLVIDCQRRVHRISHSRLESLKNLNAFLNGLIQCGSCRLLRLEIINTASLSALSPMRGGHDIVKILGKFLLKQTNLKMLDLSKAEFDESQGYNLLNCITRNGSTNLTVLRITDFFLNDVSPDITEELQAFTNLTELSLNFHYLSNDTLNVLADCRSLVLLKVFVKSLEIGTEELTEGWETVKRSIPDLKAHYTIYKDCGHLILWQDLLSHAIPLVDLTLNGENLPLNWNLFSNYIATSFPKHLRHMTIEITIKGLIEAFVFLHVIIKRCRFLEEVSVRPIDATNNSVVQDIYERSIRLAIVRLPGSHMRSFTFNGREVNLDRTWADYFVVCLVGMLETIRNILNKVKL